MARRPSSRHDRPQGHRLTVLVGWATLVVALAPALFLGGHRPSSWTVLAFAVFALFLARLALDLWARPDRVLPLVLVPAVLATGTLVWGLVQTLPLPPGSALAHPVWALVPEAVPAISADPIAGRHAVLRLASYLMVAWILFRSVPDTRGAMRLLQAAAIYVAALSGYGLYAFMTGENWVLGELTSEGRVTATFGNRNSYATYAAMGLVANLALYMRIVAPPTTVEETRETRLRNFLERFFGGGWLFGLGTLLCAAGLVLSQSRAGTIAGVIGVAVLLLARRRGDRGETALLVTVGVIFGFVLWALSSGLSERLAATGDEEGRFLVYRAMIFSILERPYLGHGLGAFQDVFRAHLPVAVAAVDWSLAHNTYLENALELGIPAMAALVLALAWIGVLLGRGGLRRSGDAIFPRVAFAALAAAAFHAAFDFSLQIPAVSLLLAALVGIGLARLDR